MHLLRSSKSWQVFSRGRHALSGTEYLIQEVETMRTLKILLCALIFLLYCASL